MSTNNDLPSPQSSQAEFSPWAVFAHLDFFLLWSSGVATSISALLRTLVSAQWLYETTGSAAQLGLLGAVQLLQLPLALYGGSLADRVDRKKLMVLTQVAGSLMLLLLVILAAGNALRPWHIFVVTGVSGMVNMLGGSARPAMLPRVIPRGLLTHAVTTLTVTSQLAMVIGPIVFWQVFDHLGVSNAFAVAAGFGLASVVMPLLIRASGKADVTERQSTLRSLKDGTIFVMRHPLLPGLYILDLGVTVVSFYRQLFPVFAKQLYGLGATGTGLLNTANAIGGIIGTFMVFYTGRFSRKGMLVLVATLVYSVFLIAFGLNRSFVLGLAIVGVLGMTDSVSMTMRQAIVQLTTPDQMLGRATSFRSFAAMSANNLGQVEVGMLSAIIGAGQTMLIGGVLSVLFVLAVWRLLPSIRRYNFDVGETVDPVGAGRAG